MSEALKPLVAGLCLSLMFLAFGGGILAYSIRLWREGRRSAGWPAAEGVVTASRMWGGRWNNSARNSRTAYEFEVGGRLYASDRVCFGTLQSDAEKRAQVERFPVGRRVEVFYDPADPARSVLEPGVQRGVYKGLALGAACALVGCFLLYHTPFGALRGNRQVPPPGADSSAPPSRLSSR